MATNFNHYMAERDKVSDIVKDLETRSDDTERVFFKLGDLDFQITQSGVKKIAVNDIEGEVGDKGFNSLCDVLGIPAPYAQRCPDSLLRNNVNFWLNHNKDLQHSALVQDNKIRAFMPIKYPYVSTKDVLQAAIDVVPDTFMVGNYHLDDEALEAVILTPEYDQQIADSPVYGGIRIVHSDSWEVFPRFDSYVLRETCANGMISPISHKKFRVSGKSSSDILDQVRTYVRTSLEQLPKMFDGFVKLHDQQIENFTSIIVKLVQENGLPIKVKNVLLETAGDPAFLERIPNGRIDTMHNLVNLLTWVGSHNYDLSEDHREHLLSIAGNVALTGSTRCDTCGGKIQ